MATILIAAFITLVSLTLGGCGDAVSSASAPSPLPRNVTTTAPDVAHVTATEVSGVENTETAMKAAQAEVFGDHVVPTAADLGVRERDPDSNAPTLATAALSGPFASFARVGPTSEGLTAVAQFVDDQRTPENPNDRRLLWGFVDTAGRFVTRPQYQFDAVLPFSHGFAGVAAYIQNPRTPRSYDLKWGFIDRAGAFILASSTGRYFPFDSLRSFAEGMAATMRRVYDVPASPNVFHERWCFVTTSGAPINAATCSVGFGEVRDFSGGVAMVRNGSTWGYLDRAGRYSLSAPH